MSLCVEIFKALVPILITIFVIIYWHTQKRKEVIANEAKNLILELNKFKDQANSVLGYLMLHNGDFEKKTCLNRIEELKRTAFDLRGNLNLFSELINEEKEFESIVKHIDSLFIKLRCLSCCEDWVDRFEDNSNYDLVINFSEQAQPCKKKIIAYALYQF
ncbi:MULTISPECIES: hypothetical protein [Acinetobacter]|jgi:hypothetical protein|uniref:hypothetical protein n=1 Tax=Acinetobacter TaxID=469 RepID=UPI0020053EFD|nr:MULTISPECIES: hypothetical protein [Acinetobacter]MCK4094273.1 hypothetical protein [Acinetobacter radioresistens]MCX0345949.1 hypothetical protein [Acinetobacter radioresistens]